LELENLYPGSWGSNCYILKSGSHAAVVDPSPQAEVILRHLEKEGLTLDMILLTHGHFDHIVSLDTLRDATHAPAYIHEDDAEMPSDSRKNAFYHFFRMERTYRTPEHTFRDGEVLKLGEETIRVIHTPGHSKGSCCFLCGEDKLLTGDTLFDGNYGRYDLYGGNPQTLFETLRGMRNLPQHLTIYPGHGDYAVLGEALDTVLY